MIDSLFSQPSPFFSLLYQLIYFLQLDTALQLSRTCKTSFPLAHTSIFYSLLYICNWNWIYPSFKVKTVSALWLLKMWHVLLDKKNLLVSLVTHWKSRIFLTLWYTYWWYIIGKGSGTFQEFSSHTITSLSSSSRKYWALFFEWLWRLPTWREFVICHVS